MLQLRPHQLEVIEKLNEGFKDHKRQILCAVTGFGKTECAMAVMQEAARQGKRVAMILDRIVLVDQTSRRLSKYQIPHGVMQAGHWRNRPYEYIQICSVQTLARRKTALEVDLLIVDEAHVLYKSTVDFIKANPDMQVVGLTATPFTKGLAEIYTNVIGAQPMTNLVEDGWVVPLKVYIAKEIDMTGAKKIAGEWSADEVSARGMKIVGDVVKEWVQKTHEIFGGPKKTIVFCAGVEHGRSLVQEFAQAGYNFVSISYKEDDEFKRATIEDFARPDTTIHGLIATDILTRGFDVSDVCVGVSARPFSKSFSSHVQQIGRILRPHEGKEFGVLLDHSGNFLRFRDDWDGLYHDGVTELKAGGETVKREPTEREKKESKCPKCYALWTSKDNTCSACGHVRQKLASIANVYGTMEELKLSGQSAIQDKSAFYNQLVYYGKMKGYKDGWAAVQFKAKYGVYPNGYNANPSPPDAKTLGWIRSRTIAWAKSRAKQTQQALAA